MKWSRPPIVTLCGSTRFVDDFNHWRKHFTLLGLIVLTIEIVTSQSREDDPQHASPVDKLRLDFLHMRKIDLSDFVFIINRDGYVGESTRNEIAYARLRGKPIVWQEAPKIGQGDA